MEIISNEWVGEHTCKNCGARLAIKAEDVYSGMEGAGLYGIAIGPCYIVKCIKCLSWSKVKDVPTTVQMQVDQERKIDVVI